MVLVTVLLIFTIFTSTTLSSTIKGGDIVGGLNVTSDTEYPYMTAIKDLDDNFISAGTIINSRHILTAASKVYYWRDFISNLKIFVGSHLLAEGAPYVLESMK